MKCHEQVLQVKWQQFFFRTRFTAMIFLSSTPIAISQRQNAICSHVNAMFQLHEETTNQGQRKLLESGTDKTPLLPFPFRPCPFPPFSPFLFRTLPPFPSLKIRPLYPATESGEHRKLPLRVRAQTTAKYILSQLIYKTVPQCLIT